MKTKTFLVASLFFVTGFAQAEYVGPYPEPFWWFGSGSQGKYVPEKQHYGLNCLDYCTEKTSAPGETPVTYRAECVRNGGGQGSVLNPRFLWKTWPNYPDPSPRYVWSFQEGVNCYCGNFDSSGACTVPVGGKIALRKQTAQCLDGKKPNSEGICTNPLPDFHDQILICFHSFTDEYEENPIPLTTNVSLPMIGEENGGGFDTLGKFVPDVGLPEEKTLATINNGNCAHRLPQNNGCYRFPKSGHPDTDHREIGFLMGPSGAGSLDITAYDPSAPGCPPYAPVQNGLFPTSKVCRTNSLGQYTCNTPDVHNSEGVQIYGHSGSNLPWEIGITENTSSTGTEL